MGNHEVAEKAPAVAMQVMPEHLDLYYGGAWHKPAGGYQATYNPALDTLTYDAFLGAPRTYGMTLRAEF